MIITMTQLINERASANETIEETTQEHRERSGSVFLTTNEVFFMQTAPHELRFVIKTLAVPCVMCKYC